MDVNKDLNMDQISLIDVSCGNDFLIASSSGPLQNLQSSENSEGYDFLRVAYAKSSHKGQNILGIDKQRGVLVQPDVSELIRTKRGTKCNLSESLAWDSAFFTSEGLSENFDEDDFFGVSEAEGAHEGDNRLDMDKQRNQTPVLTETLEPIRTERVAKCNLRKSLAWDSAFFTSEGVLDPDELAIVNKTFKKAQGHALPGIQEDIRKSAESNSTLESDSLALESREIDLFEGIWTSVQKSGDYQDNASDISSISSKAGRGKEDAPASSEKMELSSTTMMRTPVTSKRLSLSKQASERNAKEAPVRSRVGVIQSGEQNSSSRIPRILRRENPLPAASTKRNSSATCAAVKTKNSAVGTLCGNSGQQRAPGPLAKKITSGDSQGTIPRLTFSLKSYSSVAPCSTATGSSSCSPYNRASSSFDSVGKSASKTFRNKTDSRNVRKSSSGSTVKTPKHNLRRKPECGEAQLLVHSSSSMLSSTTSPASSLDGSSLESWSSTSSANQMPNKSKEHAKVSSPSSTCKEENLDSISPRADLQKHLQDQPSLGSKDFKTELQSQCIQKVSLETRIPSFPANASRTFVNSGMQCFKPSGLRMPSPKIGFFDAEKSAIRASNGPLQSHSELPNCPLKIGSGIGKLGGSFRPRINKLLSSRPLAQIGSVESNSNHTGSPSNSTASSMKPAFLLQSQQLLEPPLGVSGAPGLTEDHPDLCIKFKDLSLRTDRVSHLNTSQVQVDIPNSLKYCQSSNLTPEDHGDGSFSRSYLGTQRVEAHLSEIKIGSNKESELNFAEENSDCHRQNAGLSYRMGEKTTVQFPSMSRSEDEHAAKRLQSLPKSNNENLFPCADQVDGSSGQVETANLKVITLKELITKESSLSLCDVKNFSNYCNSKSFDDDRELGTNEQADSLPCASKPSSQSVSPTKLELKHTGRTPLRVNYSFCNTNPSSDSRMGSHRGQVMDSTSMFPFQEKHIESVIPVPCSGPEDIGQENIVVNSFYKDEAFWLQQEQLQE